MKSPQNHPLRATRAFFALALSLFLPSLCHAETVFEHTPLIGNGDGIDLINPVSFDDLNKSLSGAADEFKITAWKLGNLTASKATWNISQFTGFSPPSYGTLRRQESVTNTPGLSAIQASGRDWGGYMRSNELEVQPGESNPNISIRYAYKWPATTNIRPWNTAVFGSGAKLRMSAKLCAPVYNDFSNPVGSRAIGFGQIIAIVQDMSGSTPRPVNIILRWLDKRGFITSPLTQPRQTINGADSNTELNSERTVGLASGEEAILTQFMNGTRYCTKTPSSGVSRVNPANWSAPTFFEADVSRPQFVLGIQELNETLSANAAENGVSFTPFSTNPNDYRLNSMNVGIEAALFGTTPETSFPMRMAIQGKNMRIMTVIP